MVDIQLLGKEDILKFTEPEQLFTDKNSIKEEYKKLAKKWHPDVNDGIDEVFVHIKELRDAADAKVVWEIPFLLDIPLVTGKVFKQKYIKKHIFELGNMYIAPSAVVYVVDKSYKSFVRNFIKFQPTFSSDKMKDHISRFLPMQYRVEESLDKFIVSVARHPEYISLLDCPKLDQKHIAWIISRLYDLTCYLNYIGYVSNGIDLNSCWICPDKHSVAILGGWWYTVKNNERLIGLSNKIYEELPVAIKNSSKASANIDLNCIKAVGRELLGDRSGSSLYRRNDLAEPLVTWLNTPSLKTTAIEDYRKWEKVLKDSFGERKFIKLELYAKDVYKEI